MQQLITAAHVLVGPAGQRIDDGAVLVDGDTITAVGPRAEVVPQAGEGARRRDFPAGTVLPGLINSHVHLAFDASLDAIDNVIDADDTDLLLGMAGRAQRLLRSGVTTIRDLGDRGAAAVRLRDAVERGELDGPRILAAGPPVTIPRGHCWFFGGEADGEEEIRRRVRRNAELGVDVIKVMASGGQMTPSSPPMWASQFSTAELAAVTEEAARAGLPVAAHAHGAEAIASAVEAGVTTIEHCTWLGDGGYDRRDEVAKRMADQGIYACSTMPPRWRDFLDRIGPQRAEHVMHRLRWMDELGVQLITGTDAGVPRSDFDGFPDALGVYEHLGFDRERIIEMATVTSAAALGVADRVGRLAAGCTADLLAVDGDPVADLGALNRRSLVLARGREIPLN
ncbi:amidohydrolase family protein [Saccharopolyspora rosea]|nr:amidohydrolase family protein [Saccharopolyspora rosea]